MKSQEEILEKVEEVVGDEVFGWRCSKLIQALEYKYAKPFLKGGVTKETWEQERIKSEEEVIEEMRDYLDFAYEKAESRRGLSANRSVCYYLGWSFLIDDELYEWIDEEYTWDYREYGLPILDHIKDWLEENG